MSAPSAPITVTALAAALVGCGYEPARDRPSDPLSQSHRAAVGDALEGLGELCVLADDEGVPGSDAEVTTLTRVAKERPHGVYRASGRRGFVDQGVFSGDTMIQVLERAAHEFDACKDTAGELSDAAQHLRSPR